jgi:site-specific DNA-cytosine methylase
MISFFAGCSVFQLGFEPFVGCFFNGEFDPGSGRTLAACLTHASRTVMIKLAWSDQWRTGE